MTDTELLDAIEALRFNLKDVEYNPYMDGWCWYDWTGWPHHRGWTHSPKLRDCLEAAIRTAEASRTAEARRALGKKRRPTPPLVVPTRPRAT